MCVTRKGSFPIVSYAVQSCGPVPSGLILDNGPALLASYLLKEGYRPKIFDFNNVKAIKDIARHGKEAFVNETIEFLDDYYKSNGVKIAGTKLYANGFNDNVTIHEELKRRNPDLILVAGGPHVDWFGEEIFNYTNAFDMMTYGDGDSAIIPLAKLAFDNGKIEDIPNLIYRKNGQTIKTKRREISMDNLPRPVYEEEFYPELEGKIHIVPIEDSRGCSYGRCGFCVHTRIAGKRRVRPIEQLVQEIDDYGMKVSRLSGQSPMPEYISELIKQIPGKKISAFTYSFPGYDYAEIAGVRLGEDFDQRWLLYELDLLQMPEEWPVPPFKTNVNGEFVNPFLATMKFTQELIRNGMLPLSDEIVLMSYLYHNGLSLDQNERRTQCNEFMAVSREDIATGNVDGIAAKLRTMNRNQLVDKKLLQISTAS